MMTHRSLIYLEDDYALALVTERGLLKYGFNVDHVESLMSAQQALSTKMFNYALLDLKLEDGNALKLIEVLIDLNPTIKIVVLTGFASIATAVQAIKMGAINYLSKPASMIDIVTALEGQIDSEDIWTEPHQSAPPQRVEWEYIQKILQQNDGNVSATARQLKMHRRTLQRKLNKKPHKE